MELRHLEYFVAVAAERNFSRAAQRIHIAQSALSASVGKLEKELNIELFDRSKRQIELTGAGEAFLEHAREVLHAAHRAQSSVDDYRGQLTGTVTLGTLMSWGSLNLAAGLEQFRRANPRVTLRLRQSGTGSAGHLAAIADGQMDLALVSMQSSPSPLVALRELTREPMAFLCEPAHRLADHQRVRLSELDGEDLVQFPVGWGVRQRLDAALAAAGVHTVSAYEVADYAIAAELVRHGLATAIVPISAANRFPDLHQAPVYPPLTWTLSIASAAPQFISRAAATLADTLIRLVDPVLLKSPAHQPHSG
jgi:DNA-binding transcriptional LysR family regulator